MLSAARRSSPRLSPVSRPIRTRKGGVLAPLSLGLCAVAVVGYTVVALALPTTAGDAVAPEAVAAPVAAVEEGTNVQVTVSSSSWLWVQSKGSLGVAAKQAVIRRMFFVILLA